MNTVKVLVIYDLIPEDTIQAIIPMTNTEYDKLSIANGSMINSCDYSEDIHCANATISENLSEAGLWGEYILERPTDLSGVDKMITCGFYL